MFYSREYKDLTQNQALDQVLAVVSSDYFRQYRLNPASRLGTDIVNMNRIGGIDSDKRTLGEAAAYLDAIIGQIKGDGQARVREVVMHLRAPMDVKTRFFGKRLANDMGMEVSVEMRPVSRSDMYTTQMYNIGMEDDRPKPQRRQYGLWQKEVQAELAKILPPSSKEIWEGHERLWRNP